MHRPWHKFALLGSTYARALENKARATGHAVTPNMFSSVASATRARFDPDLSAFARHRGALFPTPERRSMSDLARQMPWAGEEHASPAQSARAEGQYNQLLDRKGLSQDRPVGNMTTQQRIDQSFGNPEEFRRSVYRADQTSTGQPVAPATAVGSPRARRALPAPPAVAAPVTAATPMPAPSLASPRRFPRAQFQIGKTGAALPTAVGVGIPLAVGGGLLASKPGIRANLKNLMAGKGSTQEQDTQGDLPESTLQQATAIHEALTAHGFDPRHVRMGIDAPPGSGKTTLARAVAQQSGMHHYGLDWEPGNWWKSTIGLGRNVEHVPHAPKAGEVLEHYMLGRTHDPELFDAMVHIHRDPEVIRGQLRSRGNAAYIADMMDMDKSLGVADLGFNTLGGDALDLGNGVQMKLRPQQGWGNALDDRLVTQGIDPAGLSRHEKLLSLHAGKRVTGAGWTPYVKNPLSTGETMALGASVPVGMMVARALRRLPKTARLKEAIGKRQVERMRDATVRMRARGLEGKKLAPNWQSGIPQAEDSRLWDSAERTLTPYSEEVFRGYDRWIENSKKTESRAFDQLFSPVYEDPNPVTKWQRGKQLPLRKRLSEVEHAKRLDDLHVSGMHDKARVVDVPFLDEVAAAESAAGVHPGQVAWRGGTSVAGDSPRWFSGLPNVAAGYLPEDSQASLRSRLTPRGRLEAFPLDQVPDEHQGPWTKHIAVDPRVKGRNSKHLGESPVGDSQIYEKVIDGNHVPDSLTSYKPLLTPGRFLLEKGPNLLREQQMPASVGMHAPTVKALQQHAPELASRLLRGVKVSMVKESIGKRQTKRIEDAVRRMHEGGALPTGDDSPWQTMRETFTPYHEEAHKGLENTIRYYKNRARREFDQQMSPIYADPSAITQWQRSRSVEPHLRKQEMQHTEALDQLMTSGVHDKSDIVTMPRLSDPEMAAGVPGFHPDRVAWRGGPVSDAKASGPRWTTAFPHMAAEYMSTSPRGSLQERAQSPSRLRAFALSQVPDENQGPWTRHIGVDPRGTGTPPTEQPTTGNAPQMDKSPLYEKVMDAPHMESAELSSYRPLLTPNKFLRERGPNLLGGASVPAAADVHKPTDKAFRKDAPALARRLLGPAQVAKKAS